MDASYSVNALRRRFDHRDFQLLILPITKYQLFWAAAQRFPCSSKMIPFSSSAVQPGHVMSSPHSICRSESCNWLVTHSSCIQVSPANSHANSHAVPSGPSTVYVSCASSSTRRQKVQDVRTCRPPLEVTWHSTQIECSSQIRPSNDPWAPFCDGIRPEACSDFRFQFNSTYHSAIELLL
jgi:hypothetical protein